MLVILGLFWLLPVYLLPGQRGKNPLTFTSKEAWIPSGDFALFSNIADAMQLSGLSDSIVATLIYAFVVTDHRGRSSARPRASRSSRCASSVGSCGSS